VMRRDVNGSWLGLSQSRLYPNRGGIECRLQVAGFVQIPLARAPDDGDTARLGYSSPACAAAWPSPETLPRCATKASKHRGAARDPLAWNASNIGSGTLGRMPSARGWGI